MSYRDIIVYLDPLDGTEDRVRFACELAQRHDAQLVGLDICTAAAYDSPWRGQAIAIEDNFVALTRDAGIRADYRTVEHTDRHGRYLHAHYADLIVASRLGPDPAGIMLAGLPDETLLVGGVPMLLLPQGWRRAPVGMNIVVAWKAGREATRAVHDAMPLLRAADKVTVFTFDPETTLAGSEADLLAEHLRHHAVRLNPNVATWSGSVGEMAPVEALFACLDTQDADLIVAGAYGHSRLLEGLFGGVSRDLIDQPLLPVLMSH